MGLKIAACLGPNFDSEVLDKATKEGELEDNFLEQCVELGYLQHLQHFGTKKYKWSHDVSLHALLFHMISSRRHSQPFFLLILCSKSIKQHMT